MSIRIFITGGTFDKEYNELNGQLYFKDTHLNELLSMGRNLVPVEIRTLMMIDSLDMAAADRARNRRVEVRLVARDQSMP